MIAEDPATVPQTPAPHRGSIDLRPYLEVRATDADIFESVHLQANFNGAVYGGQLFAHAVLAAIRTVTDLDIHSAHAYFVRPPTRSQPVQYHVSRTSDGPNFAKRAVTGIQYGEVLITVAASFHRPEQLFEHDAPTPEVPMPEGLLDLQGIARTYADRLPAAALEHFAIQRPFQLKLVDPELLLFGASSEPKRRFWIRLPGACFSDHDLQTAALAYGSDFWLAGAASLPHTRMPPSATIMTASLDHTLWIHRAVRADDWLLFDTDSPVAVGGRGLARATIYDRSLKVVASAAQEAIMRRRR